MRDTHPVQGGVPGALGCVHVGIEVDVDDADTLRVSKRARHRAELDRAVSPQDEHSRVGGEGGSDTRVHLVRTPAETGNISIILNRDATGGHKPRQTSSAERSWGPLLAGRICAGAAWRADDGPPSPQAS
jgi:hypothetical protein